MKALALVLLLVAAVAIAEEPVVKVTITRDGDARIVRFDRGSITNTFRLERVDGKLQVAHADVSQGVIPHRVTVEGLVVGDVSVEPSVVLPPSSAAARYFICPKDETMVRAGKGPLPGQLLCPLDGTPMKSGQGPGSRYYLLR